MAEMLDNLPDMEEDTQKDRYLTFIIGNECYGIDIKFITEIIGIQTITEIPELPEYIRGIINLRGKIIPVIDVRLRFKKEAKDYDDRTCVVVVDYQDLSIGLIVDQVAEVLTIPEQDIVDPPQISKVGNSGYVKKIGKVGTATKLLLDCEMLLTEHEFDGVHEAV